MLRCMAGDSEVAHDSVSESQFEGIVGEFNDHALFSLRNLILSAENGDSILAAETVLAQIVARRL